MALQTPRRFNQSGRPSFNTASSPNLNVSQSTAMARKASLNALTGASPRGDGEADVGDAVDVPGGMHGVVKFVGSVAGKKGIFAGVELSKEFASKGKNDGDVDGTRYFTTTVSGAGIFLPLHRAQKRLSPASTDNSFPPTPTTPGYQFHNAKPAADSPPTPSIPKFSQSVGPGRAPSPQFKQSGRPSLPRPESPSRRQPTFATPSRSATSGSLSKSVGPRYGATSPGPSKLTSMQQQRTPNPMRSPSRKNSRLGYYDSINEDSETTPRFARPSSRSGGERVRLLEQQLAERDKQLKEQASSLAEMEASLAELQQLIPNDGVSPGTRAGSHDLGPADADVSQLRTLLREKNDKIAALTAEFDAHRADFRSTIDTLELASTETERVYEKRVEDLMAEVRDLNSRGADVENVALQLKQLEELVQELEEGLEDARRGEAEARGEVEFLRGEVERGRSELRREREKAAQALKNAGAGLQNGSSPSGPREVEARDDEIRGLKAIIHSLSSGGPAERNSPAPARTGVDLEEHNKLKQAVERLEHEKSELQGLIERKAYREEELERELERSRQRNSVTSNGEAGSSTRTPTQLSMRNSQRDSKGTVVSWRGSPRRPTTAHRNTGGSSGGGAAKPLEPTPETDASERASEASEQPWCEMCETTGHDILNCTNVMSGGRPSSSKPERLDLRGQRRPSDHVESPMSPAPTTAVPPLSTQLSPNVDRPSPLTPSKKLPSPRPSAASPPAPAEDAPKYNPYDSSAVPGKGEREADLSKWCALCERDGHDATNCPFEDAF